MRVMIFDTETTGIPVYDRPSDHPAQPHLVQLAAAIIDGQTGDVIEDFSALIYPERWDIPTAAAAVHGITTERAAKEGIPLGEALEWWVPKAHEMDQVACFNAAFDLRIMRTAMMRDGCTRAECDAFKAMLEPKKYCLMQACRPLVALPPTDKMLATGRRGNKPPKLSEAYQAIIGTPMRSDAHDARADVSASIDLWCALNLSQGLVA